jgi:5-methylcytosine-specific restriction protein A
VAHSKAIKKQLSVRRGSAHERGYGIRWQVARVAHLRDHPLCVRCLALGDTTAANVVDHIKPHKGDQALFWQRDNWQSLCKRCHDYKTATEDGGFGR